MKGETDEKDITEIREGYYLQAFSNQFLSDSLSASDMFLFYFFTKLS